MYTVELPREVHVADLIDKNLPRDYKSYPPPLLETWMINKNSAAVIQSVSQKLVTKTANIHNHSFICHKEPNGLLGCRLCKKSGLTSVTGPVELDR